MAGPEHIDPAAERRSALETAWAAVDAKAVSYPGNVKLPVTLNAVAMTALELDQASVRASRVDLLNRALQAHWMLQAARRVGY